VPFLVRIGRIQTNVSGVGARGYGVFRAGRTVVTLFGKVEALGSGKTRFFWRRQPGSKTYRCSSTEAARQLARRLVREQLSEGVERRLRAPAGDCAHLLSV
jgi:hypothetical protein